MEQIAAAAKTGIHPAALKSALYMPEFANKMIALNKNSGIVVLWKQYQYMKWKETRHLLDLLASYKLPLRLVKWDNEQDSGGYLVIENGEASPDFNTEAFLDILDEIAALNKELQKTRNGSSAFFREKKMELTKKLLQLLDVYCLPLQLKGNNR